MHKCARKSRKRARARFIASARVYDSCALICAQISLKFLLMVNYYLINLSFKFKCKDDLKKEDSLKNEDNLKN